MNDMKSEDIPKPTNSRLHQFFTNQTKYKLIAVTCIFIGVAIIMFLGCFHFFAGIFIGSLFLIIAVILREGFQKKINVNPQSIGERVYLHYVNRSQNKFNAFTCFLGGVACIFLYYFDKEFQRGIGYLGVLFIFIGLDWLERHFAYRIIKRQQDEIEKLKNENNKKKII